MYSSSTPGGWHSIAESFDKFEIRARHPERETTKQELKMVRTEISLFLKNVPGELGRLVSLLGSESINIDYVYGTVSSPDEKCLFVFCRS